MRSISRCRGLRYNGAMSDVDAAAPRVRKLAASMGVALHDDAVEPLAQYVTTATRWSSKINLAGGRTPSERDEILLADALVLAELLTEPARIVDVGAGVGAPALPLLLLREGLSAVLLEPRHKRAAFLRTVSAQLELEQRVRVVQTRVEPDAPEVEGAPFDLALSRATFAPEVWLTLGMRLAERVVVLGREDVPTAPEGVVRETVRRYELPSAGSPRTAGVYRRERCV